MSEELSQSTAVFNDSISENNGLSLISDQHKNVYSVGISTGGFAEIRAYSIIPYHRQSH